MDDDTDDAHDIELWRQRAICNLPLRGKVFLFGAAMSRDEAADMLLDTTLSGKDIRAICRARAEPDDKGNG